MRVQLRDRLVKSIESKSVVAQMHVTFSNDLGPGGAGSFPWKTMK